MILIIQLSSKKKINIIIASDPASGAEMTTLLQEFKPVADRITSAQGELQNNESKALDELNTIDIELLK
jgi:hypothetical protein